MPGEAHRFVDALTLSKQSYTSGDSLLENRPSIVEESEELVVGDGVQDIRSLASGDHNAFAAQHRQVLGHIRPTHPQRLLQVAH